MSIVIYKSARVISNRERQVLEMISYGHSSSEIADLLYLSYHTIIDHRKAIMNKLCARNAAEMIRIGFEKGILSL